MKSPEETKPESWHRFFGSSANNAAWALAELSPGEVNHRELLNAAHAAAWHWQQVGSELQRMRALMLLAQAHAQVGLGTTALAYAEEVRTFFLAAADTPDWEIAFTHVIHAYAAWAARSVEQHTHSYARALLAVAAIAEEEDRNIVQLVFRHVPAPATRADA
jgi:hypothetical protein